MNANKCPNCGAKVKFASETDYSRGYPVSTSTRFLCGSSMSESPPLIRCTKGETSTSKKLILVNPQGKELIHNLYVCSDTYARTFVAETYRTLKLVRIENIP